MSVQLAQHYRFTVDQYQRMAADGYIGPNDRVELIDGEIVEMSPIGSRHNAAVNRLARMLFDAVGADAGIVQVQGAVRLNDEHSPHPDLVVLRPRERHYDSALPAPADILLLIEVAETSVNFDRNTKALRYAQHGVSEYWIVDLVSSVVVLHTDPRPAGYQIVRTIQRDQSWAPLLLPGISIFGKDIFG